MANIILWNSFNINHSPMRTMSCYQLASWLRQHGYTAVVIDFCHLMGADRLAEVTEKYIGSDTLAVGVSTNFWNSNVDYGMTASEPLWVQLAREIVERRNPFVKWILGGNFVYSPNIKMSWRIFKWHAEDELLKWMDENSSKLKRRELFDITTSTQYFHSTDFIQPNEVLPIELGRGCQFKCKFCSYPLIGKKKGTYLRQFDHIRESFIRNYNEWGTTKYYFLDDTVNESDEKVQALAEIVQALPFELKWVGYNRLDLIGSKPETIKWLKDSGLKSPFFGIESFHPGASKIVGKGWIGKHGKDFLLRLKEEWGKDVNWHLSFIAGLPGETREDLQSTLQYCIENDMHDWYFHPLTINRNPDKMWKSEFALNYKDYGYSFTEEHNNFEWKNDYWTYRDVHTYVDELNLASKNYVKYSCWFLSALTSLGHSYDIMHTLKKDLPRISYKVETWKFVGKYVSLHLQS